MKKSLYYGRTKEPKEVMDCPSLPMTEVVVDMFEKAMKQNDQEKGTLDVFDMTYASAVSDKACLSPCSVVLSTIYMDRLKRKNPEYLRTVTPCDLFLVSMMVASKYLFDDGEDEEVFNDEWATSGEIELKELNRTEREFLAALDWELFVSPEDFFNQLRMIEILVTWNQTLKRGSNSLTYNELVALAFDNTSITSWLQCSNTFLKMFAVTAITYAVLITSIVGATLIASSFHVVLAKSLISDEHVNHTKWMKPETTTCEPFNPTCTSKASEVLLRISSFQKVNKTNTALPERIPENNYLQLNLFGSETVHQLLSTIRSSPYLQIMSRVPI